MPPSTEQRPSVPRGCAHAAPKELVSAPDLTVYEVVRPDIGEGCVREVRLENPVFEEDVLLWCMENPVRGSIHLVDSYRDRRRRKKRKSQRAKAPHPWNIQRKEKWGGG